LSNKRFSFTVKSGEENRLDKYLAEKLREHSRSRLQTLIRDGAVTVNNSPVTKTGFLVEAGCEINIEVPAVEPVELTPENIPLDICFEMMTS